MKRICIITVYFGNFPNYFNLWLSSCAYNSSIDFLVVTDQNINNLPSNVKVFKCNLISFKQLAEKKLKMYIRLETAYKCCDYKPMYGIILEDELGGYDFWGHCDVDLIFGDIRKFVTDEILQRYNKIYHLGHLSLYKNNVETNNAFKLHGSVRADYQQVVSSDKICVFDEIYGIDMIFKKNHLPIYEHWDFADIDFRKTRMTAVGISNFKSQLFLYDKGKVLRLYIEDDCIKSEEFVYIHLQKRKYQNTLDGVSRFVVSCNSFIPLEKELRKSDIKKMNQYYGLLYESIEYFLKSYGYLISRKLKKTHL